MNDITLEIKCLNDFAFELGLGQLDNVNETQILVSQRTYFNKKKDFLPTSFFSEVHA